MGFHVVMPKAQTLQVAECGPTSRKRLLEPTGKGMRVDVVDLSVESGHITGGEHAAAISGLNCHPKYLRHPVGGKINGLDLAAEGIGQDSSQCGTFGEPPSLVSLDGTITQQGGGLIDQSIEDGCLHIELQHHPSRVHHAPSARRWAWFGIFHGTARVTNARSVAG